MGRIITRQSALRPIVARESRDIVNKEEINEILRSSTDGFRLPKRRKPTDPYDTNARTEK